jgi:regulator of protease activity HflC (stomatin/prohibitin superfamily)
MGILFDIFKVEQKHEALITRFGKYVKTVKEPGLNIIGPFQKVAAKVSTALRTTTKPSNVKTSENLFVDVPVSVQWVVSDPQKFYFDSQNTEEPAMQLIDQSVRAHMSGKSFQDLYTGDRNAISDAVIKDVTAHVAEYGMTIHRIVIDQPTASAEVRAKYESVQTSLMNTQATQNNAQSEYLKKVKEAEGDRERDRLRGEGAALYRKNIFNQYSAQIDELVKGGTPREEAVDVMKRIMFLDTLREVGAAGNSVIVVPDNSGTGDEISKALARLPALKPVLASLPGPANDESKKPQAPGPR